MKFPSFITLSIFIAALLAMSGTSQFALASLVTQKTTLQTQSLMQARPLLNDPNVRIKLKSVGLKGSVLPSFKGKRSKRFVTVINASTGERSTATGTASGVVTDVILGTDGLVSTILGRAMMTGAMGKGVFEGSFMVDFPNMGVGKEYTVVDIWRSTGRNTCMYGKDGSFVFGSAGGGGCPGQQPSGSNTDTWNNVPGSTGTNWVNNTANTYGEGTTGRDPGDFTPDEEDDDGGGGSGGGWDDDDDDWDWWGDYEKDDEEDDDDDMINPMDDDGRGGPRGRPSADLMAGLRFFTGKTVFVTIVTDMSGRSFVTFFPEGGKGGGVPGVGPVEGVSQISSASVSVSVCPTAPGPGGDPLPMAGDGVSAGSGTVSSFGEGGSDGICPSGGDPVPVSLEKFNIMK
jgi:hypothetical protein